VRRPAETDQLAGADQLAAFETAAEDRGVETAAEDRGVETAAEDRGIEPASPVLQLARVAAAVGGRRVWSEVSFTVRAGEFVAVLGPNGAGKSTLLKALLGLVPVVEGSCGCWAVDPAPATGASDTCRSGARSTPR
jgi:ABC-type molybdenum transport system ATPase subunit/photorepair protein PhrA